MSATAPRLELTPSNAAEYLCERGIVPAGTGARVRPLSGGISNTVLLVEWEGDAVVVKQSLPRLRVEELWEFDPARILVERDCMVALADLLPPGSVPAVLDSDDQQYAFTMSCAPPGGVVWKEALLAGEVTPIVACRAGELLGRVHAGSAAAAGIRERFDDLMPLVEGRIDPYHRAAARGHPDLAQLIERDVERLLNARRTLVLGDYSPKNLIAYPDHVLLLDFEVAHWGDPAFDVAFMLCHLVLKAVHNPDRHEAYLSAARDFWLKYKEQAGSIGALDEDVALELSVLLLCRVDGKSKAEYLDPAECERVRRLSRHLLVVGEREMTVLDQIDAQLSAGVP